MITVEYLDALRARLKLPSDYALAKSLNVTRQMVSQYRSGYRGFGDDVALRVAELMELPPAKVLADMAAERAQSDDVRKVWRDAAKVIERAARAATTAALALLLGVAAMLAPVDNAANARQINALQAGVDVSRTTHYAQLLGRRLRALARRFHAWLCCTAGITYPPCGQSSHAAAV